MSTVSGYIGWGQGEGATREHTVTHWNSRGNYFSSFYRACRRYARAARERALTHWNAGRVEKLEQRLEGAERGRLDEDAAVLQLDRLEHVGEHQLDLLLSTTGARGVRGRRGKWGKCGRRGKCGSQPALGCSDIMMRSFYGKSCQYLFVYLFRLL